MLTCIATILIGFTYPLSDTDKATLANAKKGCERLYPNAPCLAKLIKKEELVYNALCGPKVKQ